MSAFDLIIFDMDGTLYDIRDLSEAGFYLGVDFLVEKHNYDKEEAIKLLNNNSIFSYFSKKAKSTTQLFASMGFDIEEWNDFRSIRFPYKLINKNNAINEEVLSSFSQICKIVLLTNNTNENVDNVLNHIGISKNTFYKIYLNCSNKKELSKRNLMLEAINDNNVEPSKVLSIGDRYNVDGLPLLELGGKAIIIDNPKGLKEILKDYPNFKDNDDYKYYEGI